MTKTTKSESEFLKPNKDIAFLSRKILQALV